MDIFIYLLRAENILSVQRIFIHLVTIPTDCLDNVPLQLGVSRYLCDVPKLCLLRPVMRGQDLFSKIILKASLSNCCIAIGALGHQICYKFKNILYLPNRNR